MCIRDSYGTTDTACSVSEGDVKNIAGYWYNADNALNVLSGTITGDGKATLKLYYDRYFAVTGSKDGEGKMCIRDSNNARSLIRRIDRDELLRAMVKGYLND